MDAGIVVGLLITCSIWGTAVYMLNLVHKYERKKETAQQ